MSQLLTIFSTKSNKQWNYTVQPVAVEPGQAWDRSTPTYMCSGSLLMSLALSVFSYPSFSPLHAHTHAHTPILQYTSRDTDECVVYPISTPSVRNRGEYVLVWDTKKSADTVLSPGGLPHGSMLDVWLPTREPARLWNHSVLVLYVSASAVLCSAYSCCVLLTSLSITWRS